MTQFGVKILLFSTDLEVNRKKALKTYVFRAFFAPVGYFAVAFKLQYPPDGCNMPRLTVLPMYLQVLPGKATHLNIPVRGSTR
jgi:hypothetical protein